MELGPAPERGQYHWIDQADIRERLDRRGIDSDSIEFSGVRRVEVTLGEIVPRASLESKGMVSCRNSIIRVVRDSLSPETFPPLTRDCRLEDIRIRTEADRACSFCVSKTSIDGISSRRRNGKRVGRRFFWKSRLGAKPSGFPFEYRLFLHAPLSLRLAVQQGKKIGAEDVVLVTQELTEDPKEYVTRIESAIGLETKRDYREGEVILLRDMRKPPVVFRGQPVTVQVNYGTAWLQKTFIAASDAGIGEWIEVSEPQGRSNRTHDYQVCVTGPHTAVLPMDAPPSRGVLNGLPQVSVRKTLRSSR